MKAATPLLCVLGLACALPVQAADLGRLFFTPMQRAEMDRKRLSPSQTEKRPTQLTINGRVIRSDGKTITWVNGVAQEGSHSRAKVGQTIDAGTGETQDSAQGGRLVIQSTR
jgi:hypothetical protein